MPKVWNTFFPIWELVVKDTEGKGLLTLFPADALTVRGHISGISNDQEP
jgi:hypothetical protein